MSAEINSYATKVCPSASREGGAIESNRLRQCYSIAVAALVFYDYLLTLKDEVRKLLAMAHDYALTFGVDPIYLGRKENME